MADKTDDLIISISTDTANIRRALKRLEGDIASVSGTVVKKFDAMGKGIDTSMTTAMQSRINQMVGIGTKASKEWSGALAQQGAELDKLRTKYNPVFAAIKQYQASVVSIQQAHRLGAISAEEMTTAIQRERRATLDSISALKQRKAALSDNAPVSGVRGYQTANIAAQFQDIAVTSAMGMSPIQIALQQGTQLSAIFNEMGKGKAVIQGIGAAFASIISPVSLVTIGVIAASAALLQYITSGSKTKDLTEVFRAHSESIALVKQRYGEMAEGILEFRPEGVQSQIRALKDELEQFYSAVGDEAKRVASFGAPLQSELASSFKGAPEAAKQMRDAFVNLNASIRDGRPDLLSFREAMSKIANDPTVPQNIREEAQSLYNLRKEIGETDEAAVKAARAIPGVENAIKLLGEAASGEVKRVREFTAAMRELAGIGVPQLDERGIIEQQFNAANSRAKTNAERLDAATAREAALNRIREQEALSRLPTPGEKPNFESIEPKKVRKTGDERKAERQAERDANAYRDLVKSAQDRIDQLELEEQLVGKTGVAAETMRMKLELLQKAQDKGRNISDQQRKQIEGLAEAYGKAAEKVTALSLAEELRFEQDQLFRSPTEQRVYSTLRSAGLDPESDYGQMIAGQIRMNEKLAEARDLTLDFARGFTQDLMNGVSAMDALANAAGRLGQKLIDMALDQAINGLFQNLGGLLGGGSGFGSSYFPPVPSMGGFMYSSGGYTGPGGKYDPAGIVHKGEYVVPKNVVDRIGVNNIERLMGGFANGGYVGGPRVPNIPSAANTNVPNITFAPVIDARGADVAAVARLSEELNRMQREMPATVLGTMRNAKKTRNWRGS